MAQESPSWWLKRNTGRTLKCPLDTKRTTVRAKDHTSGSTFRPQQMAHLPETRVSEAAFFTDAVVDFACPVYVKIKSRPEKEKKKSYICLFTCATSRVVHLELTPDLSTKDFIRCLRTFVARRGTLASITSGNGSKQGVDEIFKRG